MRSRFTFLTLLLFLGAHAQSLPEYTCFTRHIDLGKWLQAAERTPDAQGILTQKKEYHPLTIAFYGIMSYYKFLETGDKKFKKQVLDQYRYFCDTSKVDLLDSGRALGLPYNTNYHDLKAPWYSGMTQGTAISYLLRYYELSKDTSALRRIKMLARLLLKPEEKGGCIGKTREGWLWIEEYPNSAYSPQVLNGFVNGLIGLYEYKSFFPGDTMAARLHDSCYASMLRAFPKYDTHDWTSYNRKNFPLSPGYMRYQLQELQHLYGIYGDERLRRQMMIWAMQSDKKPDKVNKYYYRQDYQFAVPMEMRKDSTWRLPALDFSPALEELRGVKSVSEKGRSRRARLPARIVQKKASSFELEKRVHFVRLRFDSLQPRDSLRVVAFSGGSEMPASISRNRNAIDVCCEYMFDSLSIRLAHEGTRRLRSISALPEGMNEELPLFGFYKMPADKYLLKDTKYHVSLDGNIPGAVIFYRRAAIAGQLHLVKWTHLNSITTGENLTIPDEGRYEFFIAFPLLMPTAELYKMNVRMFD